MKKAIKIFSLAGLILIATLSFAQPPDPDSNPNESSGAKELGGNAPIGSGIILLTVLGGMYAVGRTYTLNKRKKVIS